jgi:hypothetical protein
MKTHLKIKIKTLAAEAKIIKAEESKWPGISDMRTSLHEHRILVVRRENRSSQLAYGFLRGRDYNVMEWKCYEQPNWKAVEEIAQRFGRPYFKPQDIAQKFAEWRDAGLEHIKRVKDLESQGVLSDDGQVAFDIGANPPPKLAALAKRLANSFSKEVLGN